MRPAEIGQTSQQEEERQSLEMLVGKRPLRPVAADERLRDRVEALFAEMEEECRCDVEDVPAEAGVVEVDETDAGVAAQEVLGLEVGVDEPVAVAGLR